MSTKTPKNRIVTSTNSKVIVRINEVNNVLSGNEVKVFKELLEKLRRFDNERLSSGYQR